MTDMNCHAWNTTVCDSTVAQATLPILNPNLPRDNTCHHDSGANCHVFHDRSTFEDYDVIALLTVKGFGHDLSATAIGRGTVWLEGYHKNDKCSILLRNVLHIPAARTNLISGIELDKAGVVALMGHSTIHLYSGSKILISRELVNDMYKLDVKIVNPRLPLLTNRITDLNASNAAGPKVSLASRIGTEHMTLDFYIASWAT